MNESFDLRPGNLYPLADDTLLGFAALPSSDVQNVRITRAAPSYNVYRTYANTGTMVGASADGTTFLTDNEGQLRLINVSNGLQLGYTTWVSPLDLSPRSVQTAVEGEGFVVIAKQLIDEPTNHLYLDVRRYARQGSILSPISAAVRKTYALHKSVDGVDRTFELRFVLSQDGRAIWVNNQAAGSGIDADAKWTGELIRTADGAVLGSYNDAKYDFRVDATAVDPLNRRAYLTRSTGALQAVPIVNAFASILADKSEIVGGTPSGATFRMLRAVDGARSFTAVPTGLILDTTNVQFPIDARDVRIPFTTAAVDSATDATIKVTDSFGTVTGKVHILPARILSAMFASPTVAGGSSIDVTLKLDGPAGPSGRTITLTDNSSYLLTPATAVVPAGATSVTISVPTKAISKDTVVTLTAKLESKSAKAALTILK